MERTSVSSSNISSIGYDPDNELLEIEFNSGDVYLYFSVPEGIFDALMKAPSHGKYFAQNIKNDYEYKKVS